MSVYQKKRKDGTTAWYYDFMHNNLRYRGVGGTTKSQAQRILDKVRSKVLSGEFELEEPASNPRIEKFADLYLKRRQHLRSKKRDALSVRTLLKFFSGKVLLAIKPSDIEDYKVKRKAEGVSGGTVNRELAALKRMFNLAIKWSAAKKNPVNQVDFLEEPPGRTRFLTEEEAGRLIDSCAEHLKPIVITALNTGMRLGEILGLKWEGVHIEHVIKPYIELRVTKNNESRNIPLNEDMVALLRELRNQSQISGYVFLSLRKGQLKSVRKPFEAALKRAGIGNFRFHDLRHTFASHFVMNGGDLLTLKEILGHSSLRMVERYAHLAEGHKHMQVNNLSGKFTNCHPIATSTKILKMAANDNS
jgi:integrase